MHRLRIQLTAYYPPTKRTIEVEKVWTRESRVACNIAATHYLNKLSKVGFVILDAKRKDQEV